MPHFELSEQEFQVMINKLAMSDPLIQKLMQQQAQQQQPQGNSHDISQDSPAVRPGGSNQSH
jgi:hypothetical protein